MNKKKKTRVSLEEIQKMKGKTQWARLIVEEKSTNKKVQPLQKTRTDLRCACYCRKPHFCGEFHLLRPLRLEVNPVPH